jgi:general secretion pathway protein A
MPPSIFESASLTDALEGVTAAVVRGDALMVITGAHGAGKTTLCQILSARAGPRAFVAVVSCPPRDSDELLRHVLHGFGILPDINATVRAGRRALLGILQQFLASLPQLRGRAILVIDDAEQLAPDGLDVLDALVNVDVEGQKVLQAVLVGQPQLHDLLERSERRHAWQTVWRHEIAPLTAEEVPAYLERRLEATQGDRSTDRDGPTLMIPTVRGRDGRVEPFTASAVKTIAELSSGIPGVVNLLCDRSLQDAQFDQAGRIDRRRILKAARSLNLTMRRQGRPQPTWRLVVAAMAPAAVIAAVALGWVNREGGLPPGSAAPVAPLPPSESRGIVRPGEKISEPVPAAAPAADGGAARGPASTTGDQPDASAADSTVVIFDPALVDEPLDALLQRAKTLAALPDVKGLLQVRQVVSIREAGTPEGAARAQLESAVEALDRYLTDARRQQLLIDGARLARERDAGPPASGR